MKKILPFSPCTCFQTREQQYHQTLHCTKSYLCRLIWKNLGSFRWVCTVMLRTQWYLCHKSFLYTHCTFIHCYVSTFIYSIPCTVMYSNMSLYKHTREKKRLLTLSQLSANLVVSPQTYGTSFVSKRTERGVPRQHRRQWTRVS